MSTPGVDSGMLAVMCRMLVKMQWAMLLHPMTPATASTFVPGKLRSALRYILLRHVCICMLHAVGSTKKDVVYSILPAQCGQQIFTGRG